MVRTSPATSPVTSSRLDRLLRNPDAGAVRYRPVILATRRASSNELAARAGEPGVETHVDPPGDLPGDDVDGREPDARFAARRWRR